MQQEAKNSWEHDFVDLIPPPNWDDYVLPRTIKHYMEYEWSLSTYSNECGHENPLKIVPVYFWPGDQVDLPCLMCELAFVFNGKMKMWGKAVNIPKFLENPKRNARLSLSNKWSQIRNSNKTLTSSSDSEIVDRMPGVRLSDGTIVYGNKLEPYYIQRKGKLSIIHAGPSSQGVYFCYDTQSRSHTSIFYVVMAMTPPVSITEMKEVFSDGCYDRTDKGFIRANFNWRYHFVPNVRHEMPRHCHHHKKTFCEADYFTQVMTKRGCTLDFCRKEFKNGDNELNLALELRWEPWSECVESRQLQKREAHCYLVRKFGYDIPVDNLDEQHNWMPKLNSIFNHEPFTSKGIRLYSSLLASLFVDEDVMTKCFYEKKSRKTDKIWRLILRTMGLNGTMVELDENGKIFGTPPTLRLINPFHACMVYEYDRNTRYEKVVGSYMTETRTCTSDKS
ncbi:hypothetical protein DICVIV_02250 [Dictyocaulus viviparus]|uniref:Uncharacterized protein n=1 Tax=Dictyocaulus viviparus TaxID=29172 RepID=A0A0D8Y5Z0_DICVI|nr:hypothetical protein DICVIV_02250 [Dictyocaulus viviparus]